MSSTTAKMPSWNWHKMPGSEAAYLTFPTIVAFLLVILTTLSTPVIKGMSLADIHSKGQYVNGLIRFGAWGWCAQGVEGVTDGCSNRRPFGGAISTVLNDLPDELLVLRSLEGMMNKDYAIASDAFAVISAVVAWWSLGACLAAVEAWESPNQRTFKWTGMAYWFTFISCVFTAVEFALDIRRYIYIANAAIGVNASDPTVTVGPVIWLKMVALICNLGCCLARLLWLSTRPKPDSIIQTGKPQNALPPRDDMPPSWGNIDLHDAKDVDEKMVMPRDSVQIQEVVSPDFSAPPRLPEGRGGAI